MTWQTSCAKCCVSQHRILTIFLFLAAVNTHTHITILSIAITEMITPFQSNISVNNSDFCPFPDAERAVHNPRLFYDLDEEIQGIILSSFFWGFTVTYMVTGFFTNALGSRIVFGLGVLGSTLCTLVIPLTVFIERKRWEVLVALRLLAGLSEGIVFPAMDSIYRQWMPKEARYVLPRIKEHGALLGTIVSFLVGGVVIKITEIWSSIFYLFGSAGLIWCFCWQFFGFSNPKDSPFLTEEEKEHFRKNMETRSKLIPWWSVITSISFWMLVLNEIGHNWTWYLMVTCLPKYLNGVLKYDIGQTALWSSLPFFSYWIMSGIFGYLSDLLIERQYFRTAGTRKGYCLVGALGTGFFMLLASYSACDRTGAVGWITVAMIFMSSHRASVKGTIWDVSPNYGGTLTELVDAFGNLSGMMVPYFVGLITAEQSVRQWRYVFWISFYVYATVSFAFLIFGSAAPESWDDNNNNIDNNKS